MNTVFHRVGETIEAISAVSVGVSNLSSLLDFASYILFALACLQLAKKTGIPYGWRGFIPFADQWLLGRLMDVGKPRGNTHWQLLVLFIGKQIGLFVYKLLSGVSKALTVADRFFEVTLPAALTNSLDIAVVFCLIGYACSIGYMVLLCTGYYRLAKKFAKESYIGYFVLLVVGALLSPLASAIALLLLSRKEPAELQNSVD